MDYSLQVVWSCSSQQSANKMKKKNATDFQVFYFIFIYLFFIKGRHNAS